MQCVPLRSAALERRIEDDGAGFAGEGLQHAKRYGHDRRSGGNSGCRAAVGEGDVHRDAPAGPRDVLHDRAKADVIADRFGE